MNLKCMMHACTIQCTCIHTGCTARPRVATVQCGGRGSSVVYKNHDVTTPRSPALAVQAAVPPLTCQCRSAVYTCMLVCIHAALRAPRQIHAHTADAAVHTYDTHTCTQTLSDRLGRRATAPPSRRTRHTHAGHGKALPPQVRTGTGQKPLRTRRWRVHSTRLHTHTLSHTTPPPRLTTAHATQRPPGAPLQPRRRGPCLRARSRGRRGPAAPSPPPRGARRSRCATTGWRRAAARR